MEQRDDADYESGDAELDAARKTYMGAAVRWEVPGDEAFDAGWKAARSAAQPAAPSPAPEPAVSTFSFRRIAYDPTGYYHERWDRAVPIEVVAATEAEARTKGFAMSGEPPRSRGWKLRLDRVSVVAK